MAESPCRKNRHAEEEKKPLGWDRQIDHSRPYLAETEARNVVRKIIDEGGHLLWEHYLQHKAFAFAANAAMERSVCRTEMCFVACEDAEPEDTLQEDWGLEPEPQAQRIDSWAGMVIPKRSPESIAAAMADKFGSTKDSALNSRRAKRGTRQASEMDMPVKKEKPEAARSWSIEEKKPPDAEEEKFREAKLVDDNKRREMEKTTRDRRQAESEERKRIEELHEEMDKRPHTFDLNGQVLWVEPPKIEKLPKVQETVECHIKRNPKPKMEDNAGKQPERSPKKPQPTRKKKDKIEATEQFPDTFVPLSHGQPPILETMKMKMGVSLQHKGKVKPGPPRETIDGKMSRREFAAIVAREVSGDTQLQFTATGTVRPFGGNSGKLPQDESPKSKSPAARKDLPKADVSASDKTGGSPAQPMATRSESLPEIAKDKGRAPPQGSSLPSPGAKGIDAAHGGKRSPEMERAPRAPAMFTRMQKTYEALGYVARNPRVHAPSLGKLNVVDHGYPKATQPPLGATMGHGLMRFSTSQEEFFFPATGAEPSSMGMTKSKSDTTVPRDASTLLLSNMAAPLGNDTGARSPVHGNIVTDSRSPTYKNVRKQMFPGKA